MYFLSRFLSFGNSWLSLAIGFVWFVVQLWMIIEAVRRGEWLWVVFLIIGGPISLACYYLFVYRDGSSPPMRGFELPGAQDRKRIKELQAQIHHLDKPHHYLQLADIYFSQGKLAKAEAAYKASLERDAQDIDARAHYGQCLLRLGRPAEARPILEGVCAETPDHDYGHSMMALAETMMALNEPAVAIKTWQKVTDLHQYPRAKVQLAELYAANNQADLARAELNDVLSDDVHAPAFQRKRDRIWIRRARSLENHLAG